VKQFRQVVWMLVQSKQDINTQDEQRAGEWARAVVIVFLGAANEIVKCHKLAHFSIIKRRFPPEQPSTD